MIETSAEAPGPDAAPPQTAAASKKLQTKIGRVVSDTQDKTIVVAVDNLVRHRLYRHTFRRTRRFQAHDELNEARVGDVVRIVTCRPISRHKTFRLDSIVRRGNLPPVSPKEV